MDARVNGNLNMSRALGDIDLKSPLPLVLALPEVSVYQITPDVRWLVLASDGLWDVLCDAAAISLIKNCKSAKKASEVLVSKALKKKSNDNVTAVVVKISAGK